MKHKLLVGVLPVALALVSGSADASRDYPVSGVACDATAGQDSCVDRGQYGIGNVCSSTVTVECPVTLSYPIGSEPVVNTFGLGAYDRNGSADVICDVQRVDGNGNISYTANLRTQGNQTGLQPETVSPSGISIVGTWRLRCALPAPTSSGFSHLVSYGMLTSES